MHIKPRIIILEGLPGVGKTTLVGLLRAKGVECIDEVSLENRRQALNGDMASQIVFMNNDQQKIEKALAVANGTIVMDRGPISTLAYNIAKHKLVKDYDFMPVVTWFERSMRMFYERSDVHVIYLQGNNKIPYDNATDPYGTKANQKLLESISLQLVQLFAKSVTTRRYDYNDTADQERLISEILN